MQLPSRNVSLAIGVVVLVVLWSLLKSPPAVGPELAAEQVVGHGVVAVEASEIDDAMDFVADDFHGQVAGLGSLDKEQLETYLRRYSLLGGGISVTIVTQDNVVADNLRSVAISLQVIVVAGGIRGVMNNNADVREIELTIELRDDEWLVTRLN